MRNVSLVLPGLSDRTHRRSWRRATATAGPARPRAAPRPPRCWSWPPTSTAPPHSKTLVFVSTDGSVAGAAGAKVLAAGARGDAGRGGDRDLAAGLGSRPPPLRRALVGGAAERLDPAAGERQDRGLLGGRAATRSTLRTFPSLFRARDTQRPAGAGGADRARRRRDRHLLRRRPAAAAPPQDGLGSLDPGALASFGRATLSLIFALDSRLGAARARARRLPAAGRQADPGLGAGAAGDRAAGAGRAWSRSTGSPAPRAPTSRCCRTLLWALGALGPLPGGAGARLPDVAARGSSRAPPSRSTPRATRSGSAPALALVALAGGVRGDSWS